MQTITDTCLKNKAVGGSGDGTIGLDECDYFSDSLIGTISSFSEKGRV